MFRRTQSHVYRSLNAWGIDGRRFLRAVGNWRQVQRERNEYERQRSASDHPTEFPIYGSHLVYDDRAANAGVASGHYFHQDLLVAREIFARNPRRHIDVGSAVYGFVSHVASFRDIEVMDVRPLSETPQGITFVQQDLMSLEEAYRNCTDSLSCLHALEHFGLGRYGDPVDYDGWRKGLRNLHLMLEPEGVLYLSVPSGQEQRVEYNAHRVFAIPFLRDELARWFDIEQLAFVDDLGALHTQVDPYGTSAASTFGARYGCSIWILRKKK